MSESKREESKRARYGDGSDAFDLNPRHDFEAIDVSGLSDREVRILRADVVSIVDDEMDGPLDLEFTPAERVLLARIGGQANLRAYVDSLVAGFNRRVAERERGK